MNKVKGKRQPDERREREDKRRGERTDRRRDGERGRDVRRDEPRR